MWVSFKYKSTPTTVPIKSINMGGEFLLTPLIIEKYLVYLMSAISNIESKDRDVMPWSGKLPKELKVASPR